MSFAKCSKQYGITLKRGGKVQVITSGKKGKVTSYRNYVHVRFDDGGEGLYHPFDLNYLYLDIDTSALQKSYDKKVESFNQRLAKVAA